MATASSWAALGRTALRLTLLSLFLSVAGGCGSKDGAGDSAATAATTAASTVEATCDDGLDDDGDGLTDCDDADCADDVAAEGACVNESDLAIYLDFDANAEWNACVPGVSGCGIDEDCNTTCLSENTGLSQDCSRCFAGVVSCLVVECGSLCAQQPPTDDCNNCVASKCGPDYTTCFGELTCSFEYGCKDTVDNDGDGLIDGDDPDCD